MSPGRIPIPSFSTFGVEQTMDKEKNEIATPPIIISEQPKVCSIKLLSLNKQWMVQLESALQLHLGQTKKNKLSYKQFCALVPKLVLEAPTTPTPAPALSLKETSPISNLSQEERFWHDLYCVAVPILYKVIRNESTVELETIPFSGNRIQQVRRLVEAAVSKGVPQERSDEAIELLGWLNSLYAASKPSIKESQTAAMKNDMQTPQYSNDINAALLLQPEMNLEERVRARAKQREKHLLKAEQARKNPKEDHVAVTDALFSHARHILRRQQRQRQLKASNSTKCVISFVQVVKVLSKTYSRAETTNLLQQIVRVCPHWISWTDPKNKGKNAVPISKQATICIETSDYKSVRAKLNGETSSSLPLSPIALQPPQAAVTPNATRTTVRPVTVSGTKRNADSVLGVTRPCKGLKSLTNSWKQTQRSIRSIDDSVESRDNPVKQKKERLADDKD